MYFIICKRPDIVFSAGHLSQYMEKPTMSLWECVQQVLRCFKGTTEKGLAYTGLRGPLEVEGFWEAGWAGYKQERKSRSGYVTTFSGATVLWKSKKQPVVTTSTAEAEYVALGFLDLKKLWLGRLISIAKGTERGFQILLKVDNHAAIKMAKTMPMEIGQGISTQNIILSESFWKTKRFR